MEDRLYTKKEVEISVLEAELEIWRGIYDREGLYVNQHGNIEIAPDYVWEKMQQLSALKTLKEEK
jgi:hypothetical protein